MKGSTMLKVTSILMIIFAALSLVFVLIGLAAAGIIGAAAGSAGVGIGIMLFALILPIALVVIELVAGILGVKNSKSPSKVMGCIVLGIIIVAVNVINFIGGGNMGDPTTIISFLIGLVVPVLYLVGAFQLKQQAQA